MDTQKRTIIKTITWRIIATITTIITIYFWTGSWTKSFGAGIVANALKTILYYIHERIWNWTDFGRKHIPVKVWRR